MTVTAATPGTPPAASFYAQGRVAEARRNAARAENEARALAASAQSAQASADRAQERATQLQVQADQANENAGRARQGVTALDSTSAARADLGQRVARIAESTGKEASTVAPAPAATTGFVAADTSAAPSVGSIIDVRA